MHTIDLLEEVLRVSSQGGWHVRYETLGIPGGACRLGDKHILFVNPSLTANEQLEQVLYALREYLNRARNAQEPFAARFTHMVQSAPISNELRCWLS